MVYEILWLEETHRVLLYEQGHDGWGFCHCPVAERLRATQDRIGSTGKDRRLIQQEARWVWHNTRRPELT